MNVIKAIGKELKAYIAMRAKEDSYDYDYFWETMFHKTEKELLQRNPYVIVCNNMIVAWANIADYFGVSIVHIMDIYGIDKATAIKQFSETFPNAIFCGESYESMTKAGLVPCNNKASNINQKYSYNGSYYPYTNGDENILRDIFEANYVWMEDDSIDDVEFFDFSTKELANRVFENIDSLVDIPNATNENNHYVFPGFHYFHGGDDLCGYEDVRFLIAKKKNSKKVAGVIRYGEWPYTKGTTSIAYIDVSINARNKGMARRLIQELSKVIDHNKPFRIGRLSDMGEKAKIDEIFKNEMNDLCFVD